MLKRAILYKNQLDRLFIEASDNPNNKYFTPNYWDFETKIDSNNWGKQQFVSADKNDNVIGWLEASVNSKQHYINNIGVIRFKKELIWSYMFSKDFHEFFARLFIQYEYKKINYDVVVGSPQEKWYNEFTQKYNGRIVGIKRKHFLFENNTLHDLKLYELFIDEFRNKMITDYPRAYKRYFNKFNLGD